MICCILFGICKLTAYIRTADAPKEGIASSRPLCGRVIWFKPVMARIPCSRKVHSETGCILVVQ